MLGIVEGQTCHDMERKRLSKGHSPTGDHREKVFVRLLKESDQARGTHSLETREGETY